MRTSETAHVDEQTELKRIRDHLVDQIDAAVGDAGASITHDSIARGAGMLRNTYDSILQQNTWSLATSAQIAGALDLDSVNDEYTVIGA